MGQCFGSQNKVSSTPVDVRHFAIERVVGVGGFGKVNCVTKLYGGDAGERFAMKTLWKKEAFKSKSSEEMLFNERDILEVLHHPRLVNMLYAFQDPYRCYLVLDLALGGDLAYQQRKRPSGTFDETTAMFYIGQLFQALEYMHTLNILHRDVKPDNLVLDTNGYIKLTDFGISKYMNEKRRCTARSGTAAYMAPEIKGKRSHGIAADIYAMGITLYIFLTGYLPIPKEAKQRRHSAGLLAIGSVNKRQEGKTGSSNKVVEMVVESKESALEGVARNDKHEIILSGIENLKESQKYTYECLDFLKCITLEDEYARVQINSMAAAAATMDGKNQNENSDIGIHERIRQHKWWKKGDSDVTYLKKLEGIAIEPPMLPNVTKANCDTGHTDASDTLLGEGYLELPDVSSKQAQRLELYDYNTKVNNTLDSSDV